MVGVDKIEDMRKLAREGETVAGITGKTGVSEPTVRKCRDMEDLSPKTPGRHERESPSLGPSRRRSTVGSRRTGRRGGSSGMPPHASIPG